MTLSKNAGRKALLFSALAVSATLATPLQAQQVSIGDRLSTKGDGVSHEPAIEVLRQINRNPALAHSLDARREALLTTGSVIKSGGMDRVLYHLPATSDGLRLAGETSSIEWPVHIAPQHLKGDVTFRLAYKNAVSVMPEASHLAVEVNGVMIGKRAIQSPDRARIIHFPVPSHILVPGYNSVRLLARQRHRVDCTIRATHELWTDIDPGDTGLVFSNGNSVLNTLDAIASIARNKAGQVRIRLIAPKLGDRAQIERLMKLAQRTAIYAGYTNPIVEVADQPGRGPGLDIFTGSLHQLKQIAPDYAAKSNATGTLQVIGEDGRERLALMLITGEVTADPDKDRFDARLDALFPQRDIIGSQQGVRAVKLSGGDQVSQGERIFFRDLGVKSEEFNGRLYRRSFDITLPSDYFSADYDRTEIHLATGYSEGLRRDNKFIVRVNGVTATGFGLSNPAGHVFQDKMLRLPLSAFRPGNNKIELEAQLAGLGDDACDPRQQIEGPKRFVISGKSWIRFPRLAHMARLPDLAGTISAGFPYVIEGEAKQTTIAIPRPTAASLSAAASLTTRIAVGAGKPLDLDLVYRAPDNSTLNAIVVSSYSELPPSLARNIEGIDVQAFQSAWLDPINGHQQRVIAMANGNDGYGIDMMSTASVKAPSLPDAAKPVQQGGDLLDGWSRKLEEQRIEEADRLSFSAHVATMFKAVMGGGSKQEVSGQELENPAVDVLLSQRLSPASDQAVWTIVTAPDDQSLQSGVALLSRPMISDRIRGETASVAGEGQLVTSTVVSQNYVQVRDFSLRNIHLIVAGWFSNNHHIYSALLLLTLVGFGLLSTRVLRSVGVTDQKKSRSGQST